MFARLIRVLAIGTGLVAFNQTSQADFTAELTGVGPSVNLAVVATGVSGAPSGPFTAGQLNWSWQSGPDKPGFVQSNNSFGAFCVELNQEVSIGSSYTYKSVPLSQVPQPGNNQGNGGTSGMGSTRAKLIQEVVDNNWNPVLDNNHAAALQLAIWKIVYEAAGANGGLADYKVDANDTGIFKVASGTSSDVVSDADAMLANLNPNYSGKVYQIDGLTSPTAQDQLVISNVGNVVSVPAPAAFILFGLGSFGGLAIRRRFVSQA